MRTLCVTLALLVGCGPTETVRETPTTGTGVTTGTSTGVTTGAPTGTSTGTTPTYGTELVG